ncbi:MAG: hypothetical protein DME85_04785 [Verrucomicrobia bacterium]|nr:MAG: hypothetical protein DME85_04785 [Verrucomicrobiota bacterium]
MVFGSFLAGRCVGSFCRDGGFAHRDLLTWKSFEGYEIAHLGSAIAQVVRLHLARLDHGRNRRFAK